MAKSLCRLLIYVNHALVANFNVANMSFNAIRENKILAKIPNLQYNFETQLVWPFMHELNTVFIGSDCFELLLRVSSSNSGSEAHFRTIHSLPIDDDCSAFVSYIKS